MKLSRIIKIIVCAVLLSWPVQAAALSSDQTDVFNSGSYYYDVEAGTSGTGSCIIGGSGTLPDTIPSPANGIFTAAANKFNVPPALVAAIYFVENNGKQGTDPSVYKWRDPPPPYGQGAPWSVSSAGAKGPFQFLDDTWKSQGQDGNGDGVTDVLDLTDAAFGAAHYLNYLLGLANNNIEMAAGGYEAGHPVNSEYGRDAFALYNYFLSGGPPTSGSSAPVNTGCSNPSDISGYKNPLRDVPNLSGMRIDEGVDYGGDGPVYAIGNGKVVYMSTNTGWPGGNYTAYTLSDGPAAGKTIYVAENCTPQVSNGQTVDSNTVVCQMHSSYPFIEIGWSQSGNDLPMSYDVYHTVPDGTATAFGVNFSDLMQVLGAPAGVYQYPQNKNNPAGSLPAGWPTWQ